MALSDALTPSSYLTQPDKARFKGLFETAQPFQDLATAYHAVLGLKHLGEQIPKAQVRIVILFNDSLFKY